MRCVHTYATYLNPCDVYFGVLLGTSLNPHLRHHDGPFDLHDGFPRDLGGIFDHGFADRFIVAEHDELDGGRTLSKYQKTRLALPAHRVDPTT